MRSSAPAPWKRRAKRAPEPKSSSRPMMRSWAISSSGWFITGVPVRASRSAFGASVAASLRTAWRALGARVLDVVGLVEHERLGLRRSEPGARGAWTIS